MKINRLLVFMSIIFILIIYIGAVSANQYENNNITLNEKIDDNDINLDSVRNEELISINYNNEIVGDTSPTTKTVKPDKNPNQVLFPTVQPAINEANPGDTLILRGSFVHCHFTINKQLNIVAYNKKTTVGPCPHHTHEGVSDFGVFYIPESGSGSTIKGFTFLNNDDSKTPFSILIDGASDIVIEDCIMDFVDDSKQKYNGIIIKNANGVTLKNLHINNTINGIIIENSSNINIINCTISNTENNGITISERCSNININSNTILNNGKSGISLVSVDNVFIINNFIQNNGLKNSDYGSGIYVNSNITKLTVKGNVFLSNGLHAIMYDYRCRNLDNTNGANLLTVVDNNYFKGHSSMILHHRVYEKTTNGGYNYDEVNDVYVSAFNGDYSEGKSYSYMIHSFVDGDSICGFTYYTPKIPWTLNAPGNNGKYDFSLSISNITQIKKGVYQVSIVDKDGNIAADFNNFNVTFYLNDFTSANSNSKTVKIQNGVATVDFRDLKDKYLETGNIITAEFPGVSTNVEYNPHVQFKVEDLDIPGVLTETKLTSNNLNMIYGSGKEVTVKLTDINGKLLVDKSVYIKINSYSVKRNTNSNGEVKLPVTVDVGTYIATLTFNGDEEYKKSSTTIKVVISKANSKLVPQTLTTYPISDDYFKVKLTDDNRNLISNQKVTFKINGKQYSAKTDKNGIAKVKVFLTSKKTYGVSIKFNGNNNYKSTSKTGKIIVKSGSKKSKIMSKNIKVKKNSKKVFSFKLTSKGKSISKQKIIVKINGKTKIVKTNSKGIAKITIKLKKAKKYKINMKFLGNKEFNAVSKTNKITVTN